MEIEEIKKRYQPAAENWRRELYHYIVDIKDLLQRVEDEKKKYYEIIKLNGRLVDRVEKMAQDLKKAEADLAKLREAVEKHRGTTKEMNEGMPDWDHDKELYKVRDGIK